MATVSAAIPSELPIGDRQIAGEGTPEAAWAAWAALDNLDRIAVDDLAPPGARAVIVAPHPDDEVLACGGLISLMSELGRSVLVIGVTDGEASHPGSSRWTPPLLAQRRRQERESGLESLGLTQLAASVVALEIPDGGVTGREKDLRTELERRLEPGDTVFTTWHLDGHPDHEATGRAATAAAQARGVRCWEMPVWMWHWARPGDMRVPWRRMRRLDLGTAARARKARAIEAHATQLRSFPEESAQPVLPGWALARLMRRYEIFIERRPVA